ncbi:MAG: hypothetical protein FWE74_05385 [Oscillospiraceae bacterium]|nr:hypothetical protein [Oscillospiraceae bacterium]
MKAKEFESYTRGIAYHAIKFERGEIDGKTFVKALKVQLGTEVFDETKKILDEADN